MEADEAPGCNKWQIWSDMTYMADMADVSKFSKLFSAEVNSTSAQARNSAFLTLGCLTAAPFALVMLLVGFQFQHHFCHKIMFSGWWRFSVTAGCRLPWREESHSLPRFSGQISNDISFGG